MSDTCPHCQSDLRGAAIPPEHREHYGGKTHYSRAIAVWDGVNVDVQFVQCPDCLHRFERTP